MPRNLVLIPRSESRLSGTTRIDSGYAKGYTPEEMRRWAEDAERLRKTSPADIERWCSTPPEQLTPEQQRLTRVHKELYTEHQRGIHGCLRDDGTVELDGGRHRAAYMAERGEAVPVWVWSDDSRKLDAFQADCARELGREDPERAALQLREAQCEQARRPLQRRREDDNRGDGRER
jgi:hypothetical protein